jgi:beta-N-acetylhexosaminidase
VETIMNRDLPPFRAAVEAGVPMVMAGYLVYPTLDPERPANLSPAAMKLLREDLNFDGVILMDDLAMEGATRGGAPAQAAVEAVGTGVNLLLITGTLEEQTAAYEAVVAAVESGEIPSERIDAFVQRIAYLKHR